jgi:hypothetical protein
MRVAMRWVAVWAALLLGSPSALTAQAGGARFEVDYLILVDVSGSMVGLPEGSGNPVIFPQVKAALSSFLQSLEPGTRVTLWPFANGLRTPGEFPIRTRADIDAAVRFVESLEADGNATWVYRSLNEAFDTYDRERGAAADRIAALMVFTDGLDNGPERLTMTEVVDRFGLARRDGDILYYATLGVRLPEEDRRAFANAPFASLVESEEGSVRPIVTIHPTLLNLDFGNLRAGGKSSRVEPFDVRGTAGVDRGPPLRVRASFPELEAQGSIARVNPAQLDPGPDTRIELEILNPESVRGDAFEGVLELESLDPTVVVTPTRISVRFVWQPPRVVRLIEPCAGEALCDLGALDPWRGEGVAGFSIRLDPDTAARRLGGDFTARVRMDDSTAALGPDLLRINGQTGETHLIDALSDSIVVAVQLDPATAAEGVHGGWLFFEGSSAEVAGLDSVRIGFTVPARPWGLVEWLQAVLGTLLLVACGWLAFRIVKQGGLTPPKMRGRLEVIRGPKPPYTSIDLSRRQEVRIGNGTAHLTDAGAIIRFTPRRGRRGIQVYMDVEAGEVTWQGAERGIPILTPGQLLNSGDHVEFDGLTLEYRTI